MILNGKMEKVHLLNGELDCLFCRYDLFSGTHKDFKTLHPSKEKKDEKKDFSHKKPHKDGRNFREKRNFEKGKQTDVKAGKDFKRKETYRSKNGRRFDGKAQKD